MISHAFLVSAVFHLSTVRADEIPEGMLALDYLNCTQSCMEIDSQDICQFICGCTMKEFRTQLDYDHYISMSAQLSRNEIDQTNRAFLDQTGQICYAKLEEAIASGEIVDPRADELNQD